MTDAEIGRFLRAHCEKYPESTAQDLFKALHQSAFGCGHLVKSPDAAADFIRREAAQTPDAPAETETLCGGNFARVHLGWLREGLSPETLARLFALSAEPAADGRETLEAMLRVLAALPLPCPVPGSELAAWRAAGFPALHHSPAFRAAYHPAYRVLRADFARHLPLFARLDALLREKGDVFLAVDGGSASGKTTLAALLERVYGCTVLHMDDFFLRPAQRTPERLTEPGGTVDRERFCDEVLLPLRRGEAAEYRRYDCATGQLLPPHRIQPGGLIVTEGAYALHPALAENYDLRVFLRIAPEAQRERIERRNPDMAETFSRVWIPMEQRYFETFAVKESCDLVFDN